MVDSFRAGGWGERMFRGRNRKHVRLGALSLTLGGAAFALIEVLQASVGQFNPRPVVSVLVAVCVALLGSTLGRLRQASVEAQQLSELLRVWPLRRIGDIDGLVFGVFPARRSSAVADLPQYVARDIDPQLDDGLRDGGFVLVVGPPRSGKSRTAFEAARRVLGDRAVMIPVDGSALSALVDEELSGFGADAVWWLDDLERFLDHIGGTDACGAVGPRPDCGGNGATGALGRDAARGRRWWRAGSQAAWRGDGVLAGVRIE